MTNSRTLEDKIIQKRGKDISVSTTHSVQDDQHTFLASATFEGVNHSQTMTIGSHNGDRPSNYSAEDLQNDLNKHREKVADECAWRHLLQESVLQLH